MKEYIFNLMSLNKLKTKTEFKIRYFKNKKTFKIKLNNLIYYQDKIELKLPTTNKHILKLISHQTFNKEKFNMNIKNNPYIHYITEYQIENDVIIKNIIFIFSIVKIYINKYNSQNKNKISDSIDNIFKVIKNNEWVFTNDDFVEELKILDNFDYLLTPETIKLLE